MSISLSSQKVWNPALSSAGLVAAERFKSRMLDGAIKALSESELDSIVDAVDDEAAVAALRSAIEIGRCRVEGVCPLMAGVPIPVDAILLEVKTVEAVCGFVLSTLRQSDPAGYSEFPNRQAYYRKSLARRFEPEEEKARREQHLAELDAAKRVHIGVCGNMRTAARDMLDAVVIPSSATTPEVVNSVYEAGRQEALRSTCISKAEARRAREISDEGLAAMLDDSNTDAAYSPAELIALACLPEDSGREETKTFWEPFDADQTDDIDWLEGFVHGMRERE